VRFLALMPIAPSAGGRGTAPSDPEQLPQLAVEARATTRGKAGVPTAFPHTFSLLQAEPGVYGSSASLAAGPLKHPGFVEL
jgi:hypothetical protein